MHMYPYVFMVSAALLMDQLRINHLFRNRFNGKGFSDEIPHCRENRTFVEEKCTSLLLFMQNAYKGQVKIY